MTGTTPKPSRTSVHVNAQLQLAALIVHGLLIATVILCTFILAYVRVLTADAVLGIFGSALGFSGAAASYRAGVRTGDGRSSRSDDSVSG